MTNGLTKQVEHLPWNTPVLATNDCKAGNQNKERHIKLSDMEPMTESWQSHIYHVFLFSTFLLILTARHATRHKAIPGY